MVILHIVAPAEVGGLERVVHALVLGHRDRGHDVRVVVVLDEDGLGHPFLGPLRRAGIQVFPLPLPPRRYLRERSFVGRLCRRARPDVVHTHGYRCDVVDGGSARAQGIPTVTTVHGFTGGGPKNRFYEWLQRRAFRRFDAVVAVSRKQVDQLKEAGVEPERIHVLPNAWQSRNSIFDRAEARRRLGVSNGTFSIGWVGRLSQEKGLDVLIDSLGCLGDMPVEIAVVGDGRERGEWEERAAAAGLNSRLKWLGAVRDADRLFRAFDVFVLSSRTEGVPMVLFEAMAAGTPIVATAVGGVPDVVSCREALLVPPENAASLAGAIRAVRDDPDATTARVEAARRRLAGDFAVEPWLTQYEELYLKVSGATRLAAAGA
jgi:glycosyltransferase involved in cell wall biosynthesis